MESPEIPEFMLEITRTESLVGRARTQAQDNQDLSGMLTQIKQGTDAGRELAAEPEAYAITADKFEEWANQIHQELDKIKGSGRDLDTTSVDNLAKKFEPIQKARLARTQE
jgi:hypothetical protein